MKRPITPAYTFNPGAGTLNLSGIAAFNVANLFAVVDLRTGALIYAPLAGYGYTALSGTTLTLQAPLAGCAAADPLMILYDDGGKPAEDGTDAAGVPMPNGGAGLRGWLSGLYGKLPGPGRATAAASLPVVLASDGGAIPNPARTALAGSLASSGDAVAVPVDGMNTVFFQLLGTGAWSATLVFEVSGDNGATWSSSNLVPWGGGPPTGTVPAGIAGVPQLFEAACGGPTHMRVRAATAIVNGPIAVVAAAASGLKSVRVGSVDGGIVTLGAQADAAASSDGGTASLMALGKRALGRWTTLLGLLPASIGRLPSAQSFPVVLASDHATVPVGVTALPPLPAGSNTIGAVTIGRAATAGDASVTVGGTAQVLFAGATPANGWKVANPDPAEDLWVSDSATAGPNGQGCYRVPAGGILTTEPGERPCGPVSVYGATAGHAITARSW